MGRLDASTREIGMQSDAKGTQQLDMRASCGAEPFFERKLTISAFSAHGHLSIPKVRRPATQAALVLFQDLLLCL